MFKREKDSLRVRIGHIIFSHETISSRIFDLFLLFLILFSSFLIIIETVPVIKNDYGQLLGTIEWGVIIFFTVEYFLRIYSARKRKNYIFSLYGIIDFIAIFPAFLAIFFSPLHYMVLFRTFRIFRIFRVLKLLSFLKEESTLITSLKKSFPKIIIFLVFILVFSTIFASFMYLIEGPENGFTDIPTSIYWTIVTLTTVGYGDLVPVTHIGKTMASLLMISGYGVIAVPTGIVLSEYNKTQFFKRKRN